MKNKKYFIITIDTEADNQWNPCHECTTENAKFLPEFQELAEKYHYKPVWLTTYEMANDNFFVEYFKEKQDNGLCEIGMHLHAWNNPPEYKLGSKTKERSYLIEYPPNIIEEKIKNLDSLLTNKFGIKPVSHRAGRWATSDLYFNILKKYGYNIDCSITPHINWKKCLGETGLPGSNYKNYYEDDFLIINELLEVPVTIRKIRLFEKNRITNLKGFIKEILWLIIGKNQWIRPDNSFSVEGIKKVINMCNSNSDYIMFMIHSSELMPNGSPNFKTRNDIKNLYKNIEIIFEYVKKLGYEGITLREYYAIRKKLPNKHKYKK